MVQDKSKADDLENEIVYQIKHTIDELRIKELDWVLMKIDDIKDISDVYDLVRRRRDAIFGQLSADEVHHALK